MRSWFPCAVLTAVIFTVTRLSALGVAGQDSDVQLYARYADEWHTAAANGQSFYQLHRQRIQDEMRHSPGQATALAEYQHVEYPPLAVLWMALAGTGADTYWRNYTLVMALVDVVVLLLVIWLVHCLFAEESPQQKCRRWLTYLLCSWPLYGVLYMRLDLGVAVLVTAAFALLVSRRHWAFSLAVLALAIHFKLMPAVLAPLWLIGTLPLSLLRAPWRMLAGALAWRTLVLAGIGLAVLVPFCAREGIAVFGFLEYHKERGVEIESTYALVPLVLRHAGQDFAVYHSHGSFNVHSPLTPLLSASATVTLALTLAAALAGFVVVLRRCQPHATDSAATTVAQAHPRLIAGSALVMLMLSIAANKVFSPQYLLWVLPLAALVDFRPLGRRWFFLALFAVCWLTMRIFPDCFVDEIVHVVNHNAGPSFAGPTVYGTWLLLARNGLFLLITAALAIRWLPGRWPMASRQRQDRTAILSSCAPLPTIRSAL
jgi:hypothetical protein